LLQNHDWRVASITAAPATGKSVLVLQWLATLKVTHFAFLALDQADDQPERFWRYVVASLERAHPKAFRKTSRLCGEEYDGDRLIAQLLDDAARLAEPLVLVLEDLHTVRHQSVLATLAHLVERLPPQLRLLVTSRRDVALPLARWRARSWLVDIRGADLAFNPDEAIVLFQSLGERRLTPQDVERLTTVTEGWVGALQLAAIAMREKDPRGVVESFGGRTAIISDLLGSEILDRQSPETRAAMTAIAVVESFDPELCEALTTCRDGAALLRTLVADTHFMVEVDDQQSTYRYHQLLRDVLRAELSRHDPESLSQLHAAAADCLQRRGEIAAAVPHLLAAGDHQHACDLVLSHAYELWTRCDIETIRSLLDGIQPELFESDAARMLAFAHALTLSGRIEESRAWLDRACNLLARTETPPDADVAVADALRVDLFSTDGSDNDAVACGARALGQATSGVELGVIADRLHNIMARAQLLADDLDGARSTLTAAPDAIEPVQIVARLAVLARLAERDGDLDTALDHAQRALTAADAFGIRRHGVTLDALLAQCSARVDRNEIEEATHALADAHEVLQKYPSFVYRTLASLEQVRITAAREGTDAAIDQIDELRRLVTERDRPVLRRRVEALEARIRLDRGETRTAALLADRLPPSSSARRLFEARLLLAAGQPQDARAALESFKSSNVRDRLASTLLSVRAAVVAGTDVDDELRRLVEIAAQERFVRAVLDEGPVIARLVRRSAETCDGVEAETFARDLGSPSRCREASGADVVVSLSARERDVLRFLPSRLTTKEIASECFMSVNTVKAHLKKIYTKLGVSSRAAAVERAYMLGELRTRSARVG
jgi:LuxR family maltose regulon positive regulatory protein